MTQTKEFLPGIVEDKGGAMSCFFPPKHMHVYFLRFAPPPVLLLMGNFSQGGSAGSISFKLQILFPFGKKLTLARHWNIYNMYIYIYF